VQCSAPFKIGCRKYLLIAYEVREKEVQAKQPLVQSAPGASPTSAAAAPRSSCAPSCKCCSPGSSDDCDSGGNQRTSEGQQLHMKFTMVTGTQASFSISDTRFDDFAAFANSTNFEPQEELIYGSIKRR